MTLYYCPICGGLQWVKSPCLNTLANQCHAFLCLPVIEHYKDPLAYNYEQLTEYQIIIEDGIR